MSPCLGKERQEQAQSKVSPNIVGPPVGWGIFQPEEMSLVIYDRFFSFLYFSSLFLSPGKLLLHFVLHQGVLHLICE